VVADSRSNRFGTDQTNLPFDSYGKKSNQLSGLFAGRTIPAVLFFTLFLVTSIQTVAQVADGNRSALIHGSIVTVQGKPVPGAIVEIRDLRGMQMGHSLTNGAGNFEISMTAKSGEYIVFAGKEPRIQAERIALNQPDVEITIALPPASDMAPEPPQDTVSAAQLSVPAKAWKKLESAHAQFSRGNLPEAAMEIDRALRVDPLCAQAFSMRAFFKLAGRDTEGAVEDAKRAIFLDPHDAESFVALAMSYNALKESQRAAEAARHALDIRPDSWQGRLEMAKSLYHQDELIPAFRELELVQTDFPDVHLVRGSVLMALNRSPEAAAEFEIFLQEAPLDPRSAQIRDLVANTRKGVQAATAGQE
jgi:tetratricopeptide (TPR) repeat protein